MYNPNYFMRYDNNPYLPNSNMYQPISAQNQNNFRNNILLQSSKSIQINKIDKYFELINSNKSRWQQPLILPTVLYKKFNLPVPEQILKVQPNKQKEYPPELFQFVKRSYQSCTSEIQNKRMEAILKKIVKQAENRLFQIDWSKYQVPSLPKLYNPIPYQLAMQSNTNPIVIQPPKKIEPIIVPAAVTIIKTKIQKPEIKIVKKNKKLEENEQKKFIIANSTIRQEQSKQIERLNRFKVSYSLTIKDFEDVDFQKITDQWKIIGTSQQLEKKYLRITSMPDPTTVRPQRVLKKVLKFLLQKYKRGISYEYIIQQFRSLRQDLTIQHIKNAFTAQVYEQNSKISLFSDDIGQFNQCQSVLWDLYKNNIYRDANIKNKFIGYQLLGLLIGQKYQQLQYTLTLLNTQELESSQIQDILKLRRILLIGNYTSFFKFYSSRDALCRCLLNQYIDQVRAICIAMISKTFGQKIKLQLLVDLLGDDYQILQQLIVEIGGVIRDGDFMLKQSYEQIKNCEYLFKKRKNVYLV